MFPGVWGSRSAESLRATLQEWGLEDEMQRHAEQLHAAAVDLIHSTSRPPGEFEEVRR